MMCTPCTSRELHLRTFSVYLIFLEFIDNERN
jgi:hypothetical protein